MGKVERFLLSFLLRWRSRSDMRGLPGDVREERFCNGVGGNLSGLRVVVSCRSLRSWKHGGLRRTSCGPNEADEIVAKLRQLAITNAKAVYMNVGWGDRTGSPSAKDKQAMLDEVDAQLRDLKVSAEEERHSLPRTFGLSALTIHDLCSNPGRYSEFKEQAMRQQYAKEPTNEELRAELERWRIECRNGNRIIRCSSG